MRNIVVTKSKSGESVPVAKFDTLMSNAQAYEFLQRIVENIPIAHPKRDFAISLLGQDREKLSESQWNWILLLVRENIRLIVYGDLCDGCPSPSDLDLEDSCWKIVNSVSSSLMEAVFFCRYGDASKVASLLNKVFNSDSMCATEVKEEWGSNRLKFQKKLCEALRRAQEEPEPLKRSDVEPNFAKIFGKIGIKNEAQFGGLSRCVMSVVTSCIRAGGSLPMRGIRFNRKWLDAIVGLTYNLWSEDEEHEEDENAIEVSDVVRLHSELSSSHMLHAKHVNLKPLFAAWSERLKKLTADAQIITEGKAKKRNVDGTEKAVHLHAKRLVIYFGDSPEIPRGKIELLSSIHIKYYKKPRLTYSHGDFNYVEIDEDGVALVSAVRLKESLAALDLMVKMQTEPIVDIMKKIGRLTRMCCHCGLPLSDETSISLGVGSTCAKKLGFNEYEKLVDGIDNIRNAAANLGDIKGSIESRDPVDAAKTLLKASLAKLEAASGGDSLIATLRELLGDDDERIIESIHSALKIDGSTVEDIADAVCDLNDISRKDLRRCVAYESPEKTDRVKRVMFDLSKFILVNHETVKKMVLDGWRVRMMTSWSDLCF